MNKHNLTVDTKLPRRTFDQGLVDPKFLVCFFQITDPDAYKAKQVLLRAFSHINIIDKKKTEEKLLKYFDENPYTKAMWREDLPPPVLYNPNVMIL